MAQPSRDPGPDGARGPWKGVPLFRRLVPVAVLLAGLVAFFALGGHRYLTFETLERHREALMGLVAAHPLAAPLAFTALYAVMVAFSIPGALVMTVAGGFLFGTVLGAAYSAAGATLGAIAVFLVARTALGDLLRERAGPGLARMRAGFQEDAFSYLLVLRLVPLFPFWLVNLVPAFLGVSLPVFVAATAVGILPASLVYAAVGSGLNVIFAAGKTASIASAIYAPEVLLPIGGLILLSLLPVLYKKLRRRRGKGGSAM
ncbi:MAG TPA: TVP38/TMEM64 family protein [Kiloniellaceae bacterium]|nr:TVP38/TMEM64 family protein [Kiloniellaceae bacterium]